MKGIPTMNTARMVRGRPSLSLRLGSSMPYLRCKAKAGFSITAVRIVSQSCAIVGWQILEDSAEELTIGVAYLTATSREGSAMMGKSMVTCTCH